MEDLNAFKDDHFDACAWINNIIIDMDDDEKIDSYLSTTSMKLQMASQEHSDQLENSMIDFISMLPKTMQSLHDCEQNIQTIQFNLERTNINQKDSLIENIANNKMQSVDKVSATNIEELNKLDVVKTNMQKCISVLSEHSYWNQLVKDTTMFLENGGRLTDVAEKLEAMFKSMEILQHLPGGEDRENEFKSLREAVFSHLRPKVQNDVLNNELTSLQEYFHIYEKLGRREELEDEYIQLRANSLSTIWDSFPMEMHKGTGSNVGMSTNMIELVHWIDWLDVFEQGIKNLVSRSNDDFQVLFGPKDANEEEILNEAVPKQTNKSVHHCNMLCKILIRALESQSFDQKLSNGFEASKHIVCETPLCCIVYTKIHDVVTKHVYQNIVSTTTSCTGSESLTYSNEVIKCLQLFYQGCVTYMATYIQTEEQWLQNNINNRMMTIYFHRIIKGLHEGDGGAGLEKLELSHMVEHIDTSDIFDRFTSNLVSNVGANLYNPVHHTLANSQVYVHGFKSKTIMSMMVNYLSRFVNQINQCVSLELRSIFGLPVTSPPSKEMLLSNEHGKISLQAAEFISRKIANPEHANSINSINDARYMYLPTSLKVMQAIGRLCCSVVRLERECLNSIVAGKEAFYPSQTLNAADHNPIGILFKQTVLKDSRSLSHELDTFLHIPTDTVNCYTTHLDIFEPLCGALERLKYDFGCLLIDLLLPENLMKPVEEISSDSIWSMDMNKEQARVLHDRAAARAPSASPSVVEATVLHLEDMYSTPQEVFSTFGEHMLSVVVQELESYVSAESGNNCIGDILFFPSTSLVVKLPSRSWAQLVELVNQKNHRKSSMPLESASSLYNQQVAQSAITVWEQYLYQSHASMTSDIDDNSFTNYEHFTVSLKYGGLMSKYLSLNGNTNATSASVDDGAGTEVNEEEEFLTEYVNDWLTCVNDHMLGCILWQIFSIPKLCVTGLFQLKTDINYIMNVCNTLGLFPHPILSSLMKFLCRVCSPKQSESLGEVGSEASEGGQETSEVWEQLMGSELITAERISVLEKLQMDPGGLFHGSDVARDEVVKESLFMINSLYICLMKSIAAGCTSTL